MSSSVASPKRKYIPTLRDELHELADAQRMSYEDVCRELKACYDGYHFVENSIGIYNPFSLLNTFLKMKFGSYWFETGTPPTW